MTNTPAVPEWADSYSAASSLRVNNADSYTPHSPIHSIMTYDEAISRAEALVTKLEQADAISMDEYKRIATEATALLKQCKEEITRR